MSHRKTTEVTEKKPFNFKRAAMLAINIIIVFGVYRIAVSYFSSLADAENPAGIIGIQIFYIVYTVVFCALIIAYFIVNQGLSTDIPTPEQLSDKMSAIEKTEFIEDRRVRTAKAKSILMWILPFVIVLCTEIIEVFLIDYYKAIFM